MNNIYRDERMTIYSFYLLFYDVKMYHNFNKFNALLQWRQCVMSAVFLV